MNTPTFQLDTFTPNFGFVQYGGQSTVFKAVHPAFPSEVIIKIWKKRNEEEVNLLIKNGNHKNIIPLLAILADAKSPCIGYVMPYMEKGSLHHGQIIFHAAINFLFSSVYLGEGTTFVPVRLHQAIEEIGPRVVVADIFSRTLDVILNVLVGTSFDDVKLSDFGIAVALADITKQLPGLGTTKYTAPEALRRDKYNTSVDVYSLGITIWEVLYRRDPYDHIAERDELEDYIIDGDRPQIDTGLSDEIGDLLKRCWHSGPSQRPTANEVLEFARCTGFQVPEKGRTSPLGSPTSPQEGPPLLPPTPFEEDFP